jgi:hypothetical protein
MKNNNPMLKYKLFQLAEIVPFNYLQFIFSIWYLELSIQMKKISTFT